MAQPPTIEKAGFSDGVGWLINGGESLARGGAVLLRVALVLLVISLLQVIPVIGLFVLMLISPAVTAGVLNVFRAVDQKEPIGHATVLAGLMHPERRFRLLMVGAFFVLGMLAAVASLGAWLSPQMDMQALSALLNDPEAMNSNPERLLALFEGVNVMGGLLIAGTVAAIVLGAVYFAVPLVFFWNWPVLAALLWSLRAVLANWLAFLGFGMVLVGVMLIVGFVFGLFSGIVALALGSLGAVVVQLLSMVASLFFQLLMGAAQWRAFVRVFPGDAGGSDSGPDDAVEA